MGQKSHGVCFAPAKYSQHFLKLVIYSTWFLIQSSPHLGPDEIS